MERFSDHPAWVYLHITDVSLQKRARQGRAGGCNLPNRCPFAARGGTYLAGVVEVKKPSL